MFLEGEALGWGGKATHDAQGCGGAPPPLELLEREGHYALAPPPRHGWVHAAR